MIGTDRDVESVKLYLEARALVDGLLGNARQAWITDQSVRFAHIARIFVPAERRLQRRRQNMIRQWRTR